MTKKDYIKNLRKYKYLLPRQTLKTLRGQALSGDIEGAQKGLDKSINQLNRRTK